MRASFLFGIFSLVVGGFGPSLAGPSVLRSYTNPDEVYILHRKMDSAAISDCENVDLNKDKDSPFRKIPIYDQDGVGLCNSYATAQVIDYYRFSHGDKSYDLTNPVYAAWVTYYQDPTYFKKDSLNKGGLQKSVADALRKNGVCSNAEVQQKLKGMSQLGGGLTEPEILNFLETMYKHFHGIFSSKNWSEALNEVADRSHITCQQQKNFIRALQQEGLFAVAPTVVLQDMFKGCRPHKVNVPEMTSYTVGTDQTMGKMVTSSFKKKQPVAASVCASAFEDPGYRGLKGDLPPLSRGTVGNAKSDCGPHAVVFSGQASISGTCHYLIRNSHGARWRPAGATGCACMTNSGQYKQLCSDKEAAELVGCWFQRKAMLANTWSVDVFE